MVWADGWRFPSFYISKILHEGCFTVEAEKSNALRVWYYRSSGEILLEVSIFTFSVAFG